MALSPKANYTDWSTATCRRNLVPTFLDRGVSHGQRGGSPTVINLSFLVRSRYFPLEYILIYPPKGWVNRIPNPLLLRKSDGAGNRTRDLWVSSQELWPVDHRGGPHKEYTSGKVSEWDNYKSWNRVGKKPCKISWTWMMWGHELWMKAHQLPYQAMNGIH
jgi:hypothetical protein